MVRIKVSVLKSKIAVLFISVFFSGFFIIGQNLQNDAKNSYSLELSYNRGKLLSIITGFPTSENPWSIEGRFRIKMNGNKYWHQFFHFPQISINTAFTYFGNRNILGHAYTIFPTVGGRKKLGNKFSFYYDFGGGLSFFDKPFNAITNYDNIVIGSRITAIVAGSIGLQKQLWERYLIKVGGAFRHYSDGHIKVPNVGGNLIYYSIGLNYKLSPDRKEISQEIKPIDDKIKYFISAGIGAHEVEGTVVPQGGAIYAVYFGSVGLSKRLSYRSNVLFEFNYNYYTDYRDHILNGQIFYEKLNRRSSKIILFVGHEMYFNHLSVLVKAGANIYYPFRKRLAELGDIEYRFMDQYISGEFALNYYRHGSLSNKKINPFLGIGIKSIGGKADYIETKLGLQF